MNLYFIIVCLRIAHRADSKQVHSLVDNQATTQMFDQRSAPVRGRGYIVEGALSVSTVAQETVRYQQAKISPANIGSGIISPTLKPQTV